MSNDEFEAVVWNVYAGTEVDVLEPILRRLLHDGISMFLMNEAGGDDITKMLKRNGLKTIVYSQWRIAYAPQIWELLGKRARQTSTEVVVSKKHGPVKNFFMVGRFRHIPSGRKVKVVSYHTPSHVQQPEWNRHAPNRWRVLKDAMALLRHMASQALVRHLLAGGDDNVDEEHGSKRHWRFMLKPGTGLRQIRSPRPTHGGDRRIDDFRIKGLEPIGHGYVGDGGGDHKFFAMKFRFKTRR